MTDIAKRIAELPPEKRELLLRRLNQTKGAKAEPALIQPQSRETNSFPLSFSQERLWFLDLFEPASYSYNIPLGVRLKGHLDLAAFERSLNEIFIRHELLRIKFGSVEDQPVQLITDRTLALPLIDISNLPPAERTVKTEQIIKEEAQYPFNLAEDLLIRTSLIRVEQDEHIFILTMHHIISDAWSLGIFFQELAELYRAFLTNTSSSLPPLPVQYIDFACWQREWLKDKVQENQLAYWKQKLNGSLPILELPFDRSRPPVQTSRGAIHRALLSTELVETLRSLSRQEDVTLFMILLAAFKVLLYRYSGQQDVIVGTPVANRRRVEIERLIGFFVNTLVLRTDLSGNPSFRELLKRVSAVALEAYDHQDIPFEALVQALQPERNTSRSPLFQVMFILQNVPMRAIELPGLTLEPFKVDNQTAKFDLNLNLIEGPEGIHLFFEYNTDLFDAATIARMEKHFQTLLTGVISAPEAKISDISYLTAAERRQLLIEWNNTGMDYPRDQTLAQLFEAQVEKTPEAVAITFGGEQLTYHELDKRANQLAHHLQTLGIGPEMLVGIYMERSIDMVVGLLGVLKAGGAYLPLDPAFPTERLAFMLADSQAAVLLTQQTLLKDAPLQKAIPVVCLDSDWRQIAQHPTGPASHHAQPANLAYVLYTSGSTGKPKGVQIQHQSVVNFLTSMRQEIGLTDQDVLLAVTTLSFDISVLEIFLPLTTGARLVLVSRATATDGAALSVELARSQATVMQATPATWRMLIETGWTGNEKLKILCGGEALPRSLANQLLERSTCLWNVYGPTETTIWSTLVQVQPGEGPVSIGRPIGNTQCYVLDTRLQPAPVGVPGELYIGGDGLARGYLNRPELTQEKFISNPFIQSRGASRVLSLSKEEQRSSGEISSAPLLPCPPAPLRLYKTGDLVRYLPDGNIEFVGRIDHQVKIRGFRIELGEIEAVLTQHPAIHQAVVIVREDRPGDKLLASYLILKPQVAAPTISDLRHFVREQLPDYMVPAAFVFMEAYPLTPNNKIDRKALPAPDQSRSDLDASFVPPRTETEELLAGIWAELLGLERVGIYNNFFELGGHSLLATRLVSRIHKTFKVELSLRTLFEAPTIADLAVTIAQIKNTERAAIQPEPRGLNSFPLSFAQERLWFLNQLEPDSDLYNISMVVRVRGSLDLAALEHSLNEILSRHEGLRVNFQVVDGQPVQVVAPAQTLPLPIIDLADLSPEAQEQKASEMMLAEAQRPFDLSQELLIRTSLLRLSAQEHIFLLSLHHIVADAWSLDIFFQELATLYQAAITGGPLTLPTLPIQYIDFACWQRQWLQDHPQESQLAYWKEQFEGELPTLALPLDQPRPRTQTFRGGREFLRVSPDLSRRLRALSQQEGATLFMTLLAAFKLLLARYTGQQDIIVGSPIAGRTRGEIEQLIGCFLNTLALRTDLSGDISFRELLKRVREVALGAYANQDIPFEYLLAELRPERDLNRTPLFQVFFNMINSSVTQTELPGLAVEFLSTPKIGSKFDMTLYAGVQDEELGFSLVYNADLFSQVRIREMLAQLEQLLTQIVAGPDQPINAYSLATPRSRELLPDPTQPLPEPAYDLLPRRFMAWVERNRDQPAIRQDKQEWTYQTLARRAQDLAQLLLAQGLEPGETVAICGPRSFGLIASLLGVFMSGGVLLTLDQNLPAQRQQLMLQAAKARRLFYVGLRRPEDEWLWNFLNVTCIDPLTGQAADPPPSITPIQLPELAPAAPAYVFFTSGTTGVPKGILGCHRGLAHFLDWQRQTFEVGPHDRSAQLTGLSFDVVLRDIFLPLTSGATLCLPPTGSSLAPDQVLPWLEQERISLLHSVPSLLQSWLINLPAGVTLSHLRWLFSAGEPLTDTLVGQWRKAFPEAGSIVNIYGPTETTLAKFYYIVPADGVLPGIQPVGLPLPETQALVLTADRKLCGIGESGEIVIRTPFRSLGYINASEEDERRFAQNPFRADPQDVVYYTGDRGRYRPDGLLEILGRLDHQIKIRGIRIEPGEIAAVISQHTDVHQAAVIALEDETGEKNLVAYIVPGQELAPTVSELNRFLRQKLPEYMLPSAYVTLAALPLTPNGKLDRRALPAPDQNRPNLDEAFMAPRTELEKLLAGIWTDILKLERVGVYDNFFELGGHSLMATQIMSRIREMIGVELPLRILFEAPTVAGLAEQIDRSRHAGSSAANQPIQPRPVEGPIPLSYTQQRLWFLDQFEPGTATYNSPAAARLRGPLNIPALEQSVNEILRRHDGLRARFIIVEGQPRQVIRPYQPLTLKVQNLSHLPEEAREAEARRLVEEEARRPFDLSNGPLFRFELLHLGENDHIAMMTMHHIICDGWSYTVFARELAGLYMAFTKDEPSPLPPLPIQYTDFALWQREWLQSETLAGQLAYWKEQLGGKLPILELPTDYLRPPVQTYREARALNLLSPDLSQALNRLCRQEGATLFMLLLAAFKLLLQRYTGQEDVIVGSPIAGRNRVELENLIGFFINTLVLRTDLSGGIRFRELLKRVRTVTLAAYANQDIPFELLLEELQPERDLSRTPLFQVFFNMFNFSDDVINLPEVTAEGLTRPEIGSKFDLTLYVEEEAEQIRLRLVYNADLFSPERMAEMLAQYERILSQIVADPDQELTRFSLVTAGARAYLPNPSHPLIEAWSGPVHAAFAAHAKRIPAREAVIDPNVQWTYQELDQWSNRLAHYLQTNGVQPQDVVAIYGHRSAALIWALLGVLKAGAAFIVLDPAYPIARLVDYLHMAKPAGWLQLEAAGPLPSALEDCVHDLNCCFRLELPHLAKTHNLLAEYPTADLPLTVSPDDLAYIAFTSGSTGKPKGIMGSHSPLSHFLQWHCQTFQFNETDCFSMLSGLAHDPLLRDIFTPLWLGATLCIPDPEDIEAPGQLAFWMKQQQISVAHLTPAMAQVLTETYTNHGSQNGSDPTLANLRYTFFGGDILTKRIVARLRQLAPAVTCVNFYGATETPQAMGYKVVTGPTGLAEPPRSATPKEGIPVGQGIEAVQLLVLNPTRQLAAVGELGEIYIRTPYLAKGYKEDEMLTQERFLLNPFVNGDDARDRLYKTGDLGRYLPGGDVEIIGRDDHQVKIRGFRIELEEIEAALSYHPAVRQAVVVVQEDEAQQKRLVGYIVSNPDGAPAPTELRRFLKERLPEYMIPPLFVALETLPLTPNGKLDYPALPRPEAVRSNMSDDFVGPGSDLERLIAEIWQTALGVDRVSIYDNFFDLGGYSLLSIEVIAKIEQKTGVRLSPADIRRQTLGQLAAACETQRQGPSQSPAEAPQNFIQKLFRLVKGRVSK